MVGCSSLYTVRIIYVQEYNGDLHLVPIMVKLWCDSCPDASQFFSGIYTLTEVTSHID